jgi:hypothetical protein
LFTERPLYVKLPDQRSGTRQQFSNEFLDSKEITKDTVIGNSKKDHSKEMNTGRLILKTKNAE